MKIGNKVALSLIINATTGQSPIATTYTQLAALPGVGGIQSNKLQYYNGTGQVLTLAYGASGSEQSCILLPPTTSPVIVDLIFPNNSRISAKSAVLTTTGYLTLDFFIG